MKVFEVEKLILPLLFVLLVHRGHLIYLPKSVQYNAIRYDANAIQKGRQRA